MTLKDLENTQPQASAIIRQMVQSNSVPSSLLFCGERYTGRMTAAMLLASELGSGSDSTIIISDRNHNYRIKASLKLFKTAKNNASKKFLYNVVSTFLSQFNGAMLENQSASNKKKFSDAADCMDIISNLDSVSPEMAEKTADSIEKSLSSILDLKSGPSQMKLNAISISQVRSIKDWCSTSSLEGKKKVVIIEGLENSTQGAINALLKTLEEPPKDSYFILLSDNPGRIPATILSRVRKIRFNDFGEKEKNYVLSSIFINPKEYDSVESFFISYSGVNDRLLKETAENVVLKKDYDLSALAAELEKTQAWDRFFELIVLELRKNLFEGKLDPRRTQYLLDEINTQVSKAHSFFQIRRLTLDFVLYRIKEVL